MNNNNYECYLSFCFTIATTMFASSLSLLTLTIAFVVGKRDILKSLIVNVQQNGTSLSIAKQIDATRNFIKKMENITNLAICAMGLSILSLLFYCLFKCISSTIFVHFLGLSIVISTLFVVLCHYCPLKMDD